MVETRGSQGEAVRGQLFVVSAPSGAGKTTLVKALLERGRIDPATLEFSVSHTTRPPRRGEMDGRDYHFVSKDEFQRLVASGRFLEWAQVHGNLYGTSWGEINPRLAAGKDVLLDIDVQGAEQVFRHHLEALGIFVLPPSYQELRHRLEGRGLDTPETIARRLAVSRWEIERYSQYQYAIINDDADRASDTLAAIVHAERHRRQRMKPTVEAILEAYPRTDS